MTKPASVFRKADIDASPEFTVRHPLNPKSEIHIRALGMRSGLSRIAVHLGRLPPGKESFVYHSHQHEEEFLYIVSGQGVVEIDGVEHTVGPGDFIGFPTPSVAHNLRNPFDSDVVYLMGGEHRDVEVASFPRLKKRLVRDGDASYIVDDAAFEPFRMRDE
ncbi:MAG TPA: cupin domain-containing protein [Kofleriaceae bacterium]|nr:cupin domain-containing protein [Kofleriaceae bacterium]